jgi:hypothetical protein
MKNLKTNILVNTNYLTYFLTLSGIATFLPFFIHIQWITGPIINAILIIVLLLIDYKSALLVSVVPSFMALAGGLLPFFLAPLIPFIILGNILFVTSVRWFYENIKNDNKGYWLGVFIGAGLKYLLIFISALVLKQFILEIPFSIAITKLIGWAQFYTAVIGGIIAYGILKFIKKLD